MTVEDIKKAVRLCIDEKPGTSVTISGSDDYTTMDDIIMNKVGDAIRWICLYGPADMLGGSDEKDGNNVPIDTGILVDVTATGETAPTAITDTTGGYLTMPDEFIKLARIRVNGWHRAIKTPISEDSEEYLQLYDANGATATADRPQAVLIDRAQKRIEVWPTGTTAKYTYVAAAGPAEKKTGDVVTAYAIPPKAKTAFIYYLAFLLLSAYGDARASTMLEIAKMNLGLK